MDGDIIKELRKLSQLYAYSSLRMHETIAKKAGFSGTDHKYLSFFLQKGTLTAGELAELTGLTTGAVTGLIDRFERKKLVKREFDQSDRRRVFIVPDTKKIIALFEPFYKDFRKETEDLIESFSKNEIDVIQRYLIKSIELINHTNHKFDH